MKRYCEERARRLEIGRDNFATVLDVAERIGDGEMERRAVDYAVREYKDVLPRLRALTLEQKYKVMNEKVASMGHGRL